MISDIFQYQRLFTNPLLEFSVLKPYVVNTPYWGCVYQNHVLLIHPTENLCIKNMCLWTYFSGF